MGNKVDPESPQHANVVNTSRSLAESLVTDDQTDQKNMTQSNQYQQYAASLPHNQSMPNQYQALQQAQQMQPAPPQYGYPPQTLPNPQFPNMYGYPQQQPPYAMMNQYPNASPDQLQITLQQHMQQLRLMQQASDLERQRVELLRQRRDLEAQAVSQQQELLRRQQEQQQQIQLEHAALLQQQQQQQQMQYRSPQPAVSTTSAPQQMVQPTQLTQQQLVQPMVSTASAPQTQTQQQQQQQQQQQAQQLLQQQQQQQQQMEQEMELKKRQQQQEQRRLEQEQIEQKQRQQQQQEHVHHHQAEKCPVMFRWTHGGRDVYVAYSGDNWSQKYRMHRSHNDFTMIMDIQPGVYHYKFIVDNQWRCAPDQKHVRDANGAYSNVLDVRSYSYEQVMTQQKERRKQEKIKGQYKYTQNLPKSDHYNVQDPPVCPIHLHKAILNNDDDDDNNDESYNTHGNHEHNQNNISNKPALQNKTKNLNLNTMELGKPLRVSLNHLYVSDKREEEVVTLGMTERYKDKFFTTVYYTPIESRGTMDSSFQVSNNYY